MTLKDKIAALLAKAESSTHPEERDAFNAKAEQLMLKHGIEQAELEATGQAEQEDIIREMIPFRGNRAVIMGQFVNTITTALGNLTVYQSRARSINDVYIVGHRSDVERALMIVNSLHTQATTAVQGWWKAYPQRRAMTSWDGHVARREYLLAFSAGAAQRIRSERRDAEKTASAGAELVLVSKQARVDAWVAENTSLRQASADRKRHSGHGYREGYVAGKKADVGTTRIGGSRNAISR